MIDSCFMLMHYVQGCMFDLQCCMLAKANCLRTRSDGLGHNASSEMWGLSEKMNKINICGQNVLWESIYFDCKTSPVELIVIVPSKVNFETSPVSPVLGKCCYFKYPIQKRSVDIPLAIGKSGKLLTEPNPHFYKSDHQSSNCSRDDWNCCKGEIEAN